MPQGSGVADPAAALPARPGCPLARIGDTPHAPLQTEVRASNPPPPRQACILRKRLKTGLPASPDNLPELRIILHDTML